MLSAALPSRPAAPARRHVARTALLTAFSLFVCAAGAVAQTVHVDNQNPLASDLGPGTDLQPYLTIAAAVAANKGPGITVMVHPGVYREEISVPASGSAGLPYTIMASGPGVVLEGSDAFSSTGNWAPASGSVFRAAAVNWTPTQVFVNGNRLRDTTLTPASLPANHFTYVAGQGLYVNLGGSNPGTQQALVSRRRGFLMSNRSFVTISGFEIVRTNDRGININTCADVVISNNDIHHTFSYGVQAIGSQRITIEGNSTTDGAFHGIGLTAGSTGCFVRNNESARNAHPRTRSANGIFQSAATANTLSGNNLHHNQDTGMQFSAAANNNVSINNRSWANGDHGYDHLGSTGVTHLHDLAYGNHLDGFSFEGNAPGGQVFNCISVDNGIIVPGHDLWVDATSLAGFSSDFNLFWNSTAQAIIKTNLTAHPTLATQQAAGLDLNSVQANPLFANPANGDFTLGAGSPALDHANSSAANWPTADALGNPRVDDMSVANTGVGPVLFADLGPLERAAADQPPVVTLSVKTVKVARAGSMSVTVTASDPDGDPIQSLVMQSSKMPAGHTATFVAAADNKSGTFTWNTGSTPVGNYAVTFVASNWTSGSAKLQIQIKKKVGLEEAGQFLPIALSNGFPNPARGAVDFTLTLSEASDVEWGVYDMQGREVFSEKRSEAPGSVQLHWSGGDVNGRRTPTGMYFAKVKVGETVFVRRIARF